MGVPPDRWVEEIPFDVAEWGDREVPPLREYNPEEEPPDFRKQRDCAKRLFAERIMWKPGDIKMTPPPS